MSDSGNPYGAPPPPASPGETGKGFFGALFDFSFTHFVTPMLVKVVYLVAMILLVIGWLVYLAISFKLGMAAGVAVLVLGPIMLIIYLAFIRMTLEIYLALVRMSEDIHHGRRGIA